MSMYNFPCLKLIPIFKWFVVICGSKNKHQKYMCLQNIDLHVQNVLTILNQQDSTSLKVCT